MKVQRLLAGLWFGLCLSALGAPPERIGIALGSGSMHGLAHIGVLQELEARGIQPAIVTGTSTGAIVGALYASGLSPGEIEKTLGDSDWSSSRRFVLSRNGLFSNEPVRERLEAAFAGRPIESWPRRFGAVATHLADGTRRLLASGDGALAVQASSAMPVAFVPVTVGKEILADGALVEPNPVRAARDLGADFVIAVDVAFRPSENDASGMSDLAFQAIHILVNTLGAQQLQAADVAIRIDLHAVFMKDGSAAVINEGRNAVRRAWPEILGALATRKKLR